MTKQELKDKLTDQCSSDYIINEIIPFAYPFRWLRINATVKKSPEESLLQIYLVLIRTILVGYSREDELFKFLGLNEENIIVRELDVLRQWGYVDVTLGNWEVTELGKLFIKDSGILYILEEEEFDFLVDAINKEIIAKDFVLHSRMESKKELEPEYSFDHKSPKMLYGRSTEIIDMYNKQHKVVEEETSAIIQAKNKNAYLIDYDKKKILYDEKKYNDYYLVEYIPRKGQEFDSDPYIEIRNYNDASLDKRITKILSGKYPKIVQSLTDSPRKEFDKIVEGNTETRKGFEIPEVQSVNTNLQNIGIWESQEKFKDVLKTAKWKILIESPWIRQETADYIPAIKEALKRGVMVVILYGEESHEESHQVIVDKFRLLVKNYKKQFHLIHLPTHLNNIDNDSLTGTHRTLVIKDTEFYIQGHFNLLFLKKQENQQIANEENYWSKYKVADKWEEVFNYYQLDEKILSYEKPKCIGKKSRPENNKQESSSNNQASRQQNSRKHDSRSQDRIIKDRAARLKRKKSESSPNNQVSRQQNSKQQNSRSQDKKATRKRQGQRKANNTRAKQNSIGDNSHIKVQNGSSLESEFLKYR